MCLKNRSKLLSTLALLFVGLSSPNAGAYVVDGSLDAVQQANAQVSRLVFLADPAPAVTSSLPPIETFGFNSTGSQVIRDNYYVGGAGVSRETKSSGQIIFSDNIARTYEASAFSVASARSGQIITKTSGTNIFRMTPGAVWQVDSAGAIGYASAELKNEWSFILDPSSRSTAELTTHPLDFQLTLDVNSRFLPGPNHDNAFLPASTGSSVLIVEFILSNLAWQPANISTTSDGRPAVKTMTYTYNIDGNSPNQQTFTINESIDKLMEYWTIGGSAGGGIVYPVDGDNSAKSRSCLDAAGGLLSQMCNISLSTNIKLETRGDFSEVTLNANWDASINGKKDGILAVNTSAAHWGEPLDPSLLIPPSQISAVPEPGSFILLFAGLGLMTGVVRRKQNT